MSVTHILALVAAAGAFLAVYALLAPRRIKLEQPTESRGLRQFQARLDAAELPITAREFLGACGGVTVIAIAAALLLNAPALILAGVIIGPILVWMRLEAQRDERGQTRYEKVELDLATIGTQPSASGQRPGSRACVAAMVTVGEWAGALREVFGEFRAPTGLQGAGTAPATENLQALRARTAEVAAQVGHPLRLLVGKPGLDGHSNGAEQVAVRAKDAGFEVIYQGIRLSPEQIVASALEEDVDAIGLSIHSGSHMTLVPRILELLHERGGDMPVVLGGIIPDADRAKLQALGVSRVWTPGEATLTDIIADLVEVIAAARSRPA